MIDTSVNYAGLRLKSPFIAASSGFTADIDKIVALSRSGIGAVVLKSLFEEQINNKISFLESQSAEYTENADFLNYYVQAHNVGKYLDLIKEAKSRTDVPIIASICCYTAGNWVSYARDIEAAGADAIELNIYSIPLSSDPSFIDKSSDDIEKESCAIVQKVSSSVKIPVIVKISDQYTNLLGFIARLKANGAQAVVMFNRFYRPDISLKSMKLVSGNMFSSKSEYLKSLRWIAIASAKTNLDLSASTGVHDGQTAIKLLLAGAKTVQLCSALYQQGPFVVENFVEELQKFMKDKGFDKVADFCGMLNYANISNPSGFERVQFLKTAEQYLAQ
ncbi:MAG: dihydroorotate dehydrogenase-like protein [Bacteroidales bacterium]|nr:dihydroorotate dehydrogenase-like protein [Bacteroidales bacterium]